MTKVQAKQTQRVTSAVAESSWRRAGEVRWSRVEGSTLGVGHSVPPTRPRSLTPAMWSVPALG